MAAPIYTPADEALVISNCRTWTLEELAAKGWIKAETVGELQVGQVVVVYSHKQRRQGIVTQVPGARGKNVTVELTSPTAIEEAERYNHGVRITKVVRPADDTYYQPAAVSPLVGELAAADGLVVVVDDEDDAADFAADPAEIAYQQRQTPDDVPAADAAHYADQHEQALDLVEADLDAKVYAYQSNGLATPEQRAEVVRLAATQDVDAGWLDVLITNATGAGTGLTARECASAIMILRNQAKRVDSYHRANGARKLTPKQRRRAHQKRRTDTLRELRTLYATAA